MNKYHIGLKFNIPLFTDESIIEKFFHLGSANGSPNQLARVNPELISLLTSKEMIPVACDYFVREPYDEMFIHVDGPPDPIGGKGKLSASRRPQSASPRLKSGDATPESFL